MSTIKQRILGALIGVHAGDGFGAAHEFESWANIRRRFPGGVIPRDITGGGTFHWPAGHATDDTDMTRAVLLAYAETKGSDVDSLSLARAASMHMLQWFTGPWPDRPSVSRPSDVGGATATGLTRFSKTSTQSGDYDPRKAGAGPGHRGNGSLMRCIPTALFARPSEHQQRLVEETALISAVTHDDWQCVLVCVAYNAIVRALVFHSASAAAAVDAGQSLMTSQRTEDFVLRAMEVYGQPDSVEQLRKARDVVTAVLDKARLPSFRVATLADKGPLVEIEDERGVAVQALPLQGKGFVLDSFALAVAALLDTTRSWEDLLVDVVRVGGDTDTNGAIAGGLVGARDGIGAIPAAWRAKLQFNKEFTSLVDQLVDEE